eukprot:1403529-Alexandrium_andersonii.AAC.1
MPEHLWWECPAFAAVRGAGRVVEAMASGRVPLCLARYGAPPAMRAGWGVAFWAEGCERKAQPRAEEGPSAAKYPPPELHGYLQQAECGLSAR